MKNYIANERGNWATSLGYVKFSLTRAIHFGRVFKHGGGTEADLFEAFRCLGQGLHCLEDFGAHSNYVELALIEQGYDNVFAHVGVDTRINLHGKHVYPLVTGTFGGVDFLHSVLGEATVSSRTYTYSSSFLTSPGPRNTIRSRRARQGTFRCFGSNITRCSRYSSASIWTYRLDVESAWHG
jgi:hypothetical protein